MKKTRFYKKAKLISIYDEDDNLVAVCDNVREFAKVFGMIQRDADSTISRIAKCERSYFLHNDEKTIYLLHRLRTEWGSRIFNDILGGKKMKDYALLLKPEDRRRY